MDCVGDDKCRTNIEIVDDDGTTKTKQVQAFKKLKLKAVIVDEV